jgi:pimeloyl-ACP methyl ester carboxylesterase
LICTHGWPWTFWHWSKVIDPLADPAAHGGDPAEAFEVIVPSFPGFGFSTPLPDNPDMNFWVADLWHTLMTGVLGGAPKSAGQWPSSSCLACCANHAVQPGATVRRPG